MLRGAERQKGKTVLILLSPLDAAAKLARTSKNDPEHVPAAQADFSAAMIARAIDKYTAKYGPLPPEHVGALFLRMQRGGAR
jgi:hypothetical protein